jgi:hypothetical protein
MAAAAHNPKVAKRAGIPVGVAQEFNDADMKKMMKKHKSKGMLGV